jgi:type VI secretion system secreted protein VgrG
LHLAARTKLVAEAGSQLTIKAPGGFVEIGPGGITIKGVMVRVNSGGSAVSARAASPAAPLEPGGPPSERTGSGGAGTSQGATLSAAKRSGIPFTRLDCDKRRR